MSATTIQDGGRVAPRNGPEEVCKVVVLYEDTAARIKSMQMCERLIERFGEELDFEFNWLKFRKLADAVTGTRMMETVSGADIVMFCTHGDDLPPEALRWLEEWTSSGRSSEGAIALLFAEPFSSAASFGTLQFRLEKAAVRLGMDFLPLVLPTLERDEAREGQLPYSSKTQYSERPTNHWGLND